MTYWEKRHNMRYYKVIERYLDDIGPGEVLLDVGCGETPIVTYGEFRRRISVDVQPRPGLPGVEAIVGDWMLVKCPFRASVAICLQTLEHLPDRVVCDFARKLRQISDVVLVSVPYKWPVGFCEWHKQDPIDEGKLDLLMGCTATRGEVVTEQNGVRRLVALYPSLSSIEDTSG
jgi:hypothetical protein